MASVRQHYLIWVIFKLQEPKHEANAVRRNQKSLRIFDDASRSCFAVFWHSPGAECNFRGCLRLGECTSTYVNGACNLDHGALLATKYEHSSPRSSSSSRSQGCSHCHSLFRLKARKKNLMGQPATDEWPAAKQTERGVMYLCECWWN